MLDSAIGGLAELIRVAADAEFRTAMGLANFVLTLVVFVRYALSAPAARVWNLLMWALNLWKGSAPEQPQPAPRSPELHVTLAWTVGTFLLCVAMVSILN